MSCVSLFLILSFLIHFLEIIEDQKLLGLVQLCIGIQLLLRAQWELFQRALMTKVGLQDCALTKLSQSAYSIGWCTFTKKTLGITI